MAVAIMAATASVGTKRHSLTPRVVAVVPVDTGRQSARTATWNAVGTDGDE